MAYLIFHFSPFSSRACPLISRAFLPLAPTLLMRDYAAQKPTRYQRSNWLHRPLPQLFIYSSSFFRFAMLIPVQTPRGKKSKIKLRWAQMFPCSSLPASCSQRGKRQKERGKEERLKGRGNGQTRKGTSFPFSLSCFLQTPSSPLPSPPPPVPFPPLPVSFPPLPFLLLPHGL